MAAKSGSRPAVMRHYSTLAGPFSKLASRASHQVGFVNMLSYDPPLYRHWTRLMTIGALLLLAGFELILFNPAHWIVHQPAGASAAVAHWTMLILLMLLQVFGLVGVLSATRSTLKAANPLPVRPLKNLRVAFVTTRAPGEPYDMVRTTLLGATKVRHPKAKLDVWLLDETDDRELQALCKDLGVRHFSRAGIDHWNSVKPKRQPLAKFYWRLTRFIMGSDYVAVHRAQLPDSQYAARTKHGNLNAWLQHLDQHDISYDVLAGVDTDQVPEPNYLQRALGYFRDADVAYVVGPQVYGNAVAGSRIAHWAESQASFFQSTIQRAGNATASAMFVGTNYVVRMAALRQIGGFQACITEDMATGLAIHASRNPATGQRWKSVYTPDVLAVGAGPDFWAPYFTQQWRWAAGSFDTIKRQVLRTIWKVSAGARLHYFLMLAYYPLNALTWLLGIASSLTYLLTGATAVLAPWDQFVSLYLMTSVMQFSLYFWNRRHGVSPFDTQGTYGVPGMLLSILTAPVYLSALTGSLLGRKANFVVTAKGDQSNPDGWAAFRSHLGWAAVLALGLAYGLTHGHHHPAMLVWTLTLLLICLLPTWFGLSQAIIDKLRSRAGLRTLTITGES